MAAQRRYKGAFNFVVDHRGVTFHQAEGAVFVLEARDFDGWVRFQLHAGFNVVVRCQLKVKGARVRVKTQFFRELFPIMLFRDVVCAFA